MLGDLISELKSAIASSDDKKKENVLKKLENVGVDKQSALIMAKEE